MDKQRRKLINTLVLENPLLLLALKDKESLEYINWLLPFDTGFEIECSTKSNDSSIIHEIQEVFNKIPNIKHADINTGEQRFRIPNGLVGFICLYNISTLLKIHHGLNDLNGIHYHIDCRGVFEKIQYTSQSESEYLLKQLDKWEYKGTFNKRGVSTTHNWIRKQSTFQTFEIRIGEMTFDYNLLAKRIIHGHQILKRFRNFKSVSTIPLELIKPNIEEIEKFIVTFINRNYQIKSKINEYNEKLNCLNNQLAKIKTPLKIEESTKEEVNKIIKSRILKI